jgi:hypothetical protein
MIPDHYIVPLLQLPEPVVRKYWQDLEDSGGLKYRMCHINEPTWENVKQVIAATGNSMYHVISKHMDVVGEFTLENFIGKSAQVHFSMHPGNKTRFSLDLANSVADDILFQWKSSVDGGPYLYSMFGLTPVTNRAACIFVQRCGFKKVAILPGGALHEGKPVDAMVTIRKGIDNGR